MIQVTVERWTSDDNREEIHLFEPGKPNSYIMGYNPLWLEEWEVNDILTGLGFELPPKPQAQDQARPSPTGDGP